jgi:hypothetical protein
LQEDVLARQVAEWQQEIRMTLYDRWRIESGFGVVAALVVMLHLPVAAAQSTGCDASNSPTVVESTACSIGTLRDMLHRPEKYQIDASSVDAVGQLLAGFQRQVTYNSEVYLTTSVADGPRIRFGRYNGELAFIMPVVHKHSSYFSSDRYKCNGILYVTPTKIAFVPNSNSDGFSFSRGDLSDSEYLIERGEFGDRILKVKAGSQTFIMTPDCFYNKSGHGQCYATNGFLLFDAAVQNFNVLAYAFAQKTQSVN